MNNQNYLRSINGNGNPLNNLYLEDENSNEALNHLIELANFICDTPVAAISILEKDRQWFKCKIGTEIEETPIDQAFCAHTVLSEAMTIEDASLDARFSKNPLVTGEPFIRFYAGASIVIGAGKPIGTICVIDSKPRTLSDGQLNALKRLAILAREIIESNIDSRLLDTTYMNVKKLGSLIPICFRCKSIKNTAGDWELLESFISREFQAHLTHGVCEKCSDLL